MVTTRNSGPYAKHLRSRFHFTDEKTDREFKPRLSDSGVCTLNYTLFNKAVFKIIFNKAV